MKKHFLTSVLAASAILGGATFAQATDECGATDKSAWMSVDAISAKAVEMGYEVRKVEVDDGCYEVYGTKDGGKFEVYFHPVTAEVVKVKQDD